MDKGRYRVLWSIEAIENEVVCLVCLGKLLLANLYRVFCISFDTLVLSGGERRWKGISRRQGTRFSMGRGWMGGDVIGLYWGLSDGGGY